jgi:hypothetical protein
MRKAGKTCGMKVEGEGIEDLIFSSRSDLAIAESGVKFQGRYGAILKRGSGLQLALLAGSLIETSGIRIQSTAPSVFVTLTAGSLDLTATGEGEIEITRNQKTDAFAITGQLHATRSI